MATTSLAGMTASELNTHRGCWVANTETGKLGVLLIAVQGTLPLLKVIIPSEQRTLYWSAPERWELTNMPRAWAADGTPEVER